MTIVDAPTDVPRLSRSAVLTVAEVIEETADARSLVFDIPADRRADFDYRPGQFLTLRVPSDRTGSVARCYSLASSPFTDDLLKVTVKRTCDGYASNWLCDRVNAGDAIEVLPPAGVFTPNGFDDDLLLFAAGSGITPVMSILKSALSEGTSSVFLVYANRDENSVIFKQELQELAAANTDRLRVVHWLESVQGLPTPAQLASMAAPFADHRVFMCGPKPFMDAVHDATARAGFARQRVHAEVFTSLSGDPFAEIELPAVDETSEDGATVSVNLDGDAHEFSWPRSATLVDVLLSKGINVPFSCREGECGSCAATLVDGEVTMDNCSVLDDDDIAEGIILACQARPRSDTLSIEF
ncbi:2Fe-2S iron-sulfur cluster binding domain-containing protein [Gordonia jinghuaiqii]|uniref:Ferredoxin--NADP reductase n=1 Tax=Gordonia jinghuaiqii TaxID=2758710 RepID=A0A7D7QZX1_9ACTN|nr:ferredoxin--NADP reductase [Gordonia jinghuaiqii]MCR5976667.1 2Fe-2S iron-sulfur cluster binding domain-containing protein [Gordonia jinghuaiqii]QMS99846.1 ferredoxin--NADP reductase [Gordonia jinghuaiqii]